MLLLRRYAAEEWGDVTLSGLTAAPKPPPPPPKPKNDEPTPEAIEACRMMAIKRIMIDYAGATDEQKRSSMFKDILFDPRYAHLAPQPEPRPSDPSPVSESLPDTANTPPQEESETSENGVGHVVGVSLNECPDLPREVSETSGNSPDTNHPQTQAVSETSETGVGRVVGLSLNECPTLPRGVSETSETGVGHIVGLHLKECPDLPRGVSENRSSPTP